MKDKKNNSIIDLILLLIYLISSLYFMAELYLGSLFSFRFMLIAATLLLFVLLLLFLNINKKPKSLLRKIIIILLSILLLALSILQMGIRNAFYEINGMSKTTYHLSLYVKDEKIQTIDDLQGGKVGLLADSMSSNSYAINELKKSKVAFTYIEYIDYSQLIKDLMNGRLDGMLANDSLYQKMCDLYTDVAANTHAIKDFNYVVKINFRQHEKDLNTEPFTVFISGMDQSGDISLAAKTDVNMILMVDPNRHHVEIVSLLRDTYLPNPAYDFYPDKLTHTSYNGIDNTIKSIEEVFGFKIDAYVRVNFSTLIDLVETLNRIQVDIPLSFCEQDSHRNFDPMICVNQGKQWLNGEEALAYARHRSSYSDIERTHAQQQIIEALASRLLATENIPKLSEVLKSIGENISTNIDMNSVKSFLRCQMDTQSKWTFSSTSLTSGKTEMMPCISWDFSWPLSVYLLSNDDLATVYGKYLDMFDVLDCSLFNFDLNQKLDAKMMPPTNPYLFTTENKETKMNEIFSLLPADPIEIYDQIQSNQVEKDSQTVFNPMAEIQKSQSVKGKEK